ncbi:unnamed protein product [Arabis nemorensis]|uniref:RING-CH-type domain-containing protein n=1 Tax=Arabis nemorensis TaxID=586526 RepID=A0A565ATR8_9BRAS|nr:unnamed protein product [Arabis nemorensis]
MDPEEQLQDQDTIEEIVSEELEKTMVDIPSPPRCRICFDVDGEFIDLGCACKDELILAHEDCVKKWFKMKNTKICEICNKVATNVEGDFEYKGLSGGYV